MNSTQTYIARFKKVILLGVALGTFGFGIAKASAEDYSFKVHNKTKTKITKILVSETGKNYAPFDIGSGIGAGKKATLVWDKSTNSENCEQFVKAVYSDGSESEPTKFDFCEENLEIEFEE
jgi:hypothetical protein